MTNSKTKKTTRKVQNFIYNCLRRILKTPWPENFRNIELWQRIKQDPTGFEFKEDDGVGLVTRSGNRQKHNTTDPNNLSTRPKVERKAEEFLEA